MSCDVKKISVMLLSVILSVADVRKNTLEKLGAPITKTCLFNILKILPPKYENFQIKNSDIFIVLLKT